MKNDTVTSIFW